MGTRRVSSLRAVLAGSLVFGTVMVGSVLSGSLPAGATGGNIDVVTTCA
jgi:hypothetical protein